MLPAIDDLMGGLKTNALNVGSDLKPTSQILQLNDSTKILNGLEIVVENVVNAFQTAADNLHGFVGDLETLESQSGGDGHSEANSAIVLGTILKILKFWRLIIKC